MSGTAVACLRLQRYNNDAVLQDVINLFLSLLRLLGNNRN